MSKRKTIEIKGKNWRYHTSGDAASAMVVLFGSLGAGEGAVQLLSEYFPDMKLVVPEYAAVDTMLEFLNALDRIVEAEQIERFAVFGGSYGGMIAQCWARHRPETITRLILSGTAPPDPARIQKNDKALRNLRFIPLFLIRGILRIMLWILLRKANQPLWKREYVNLVNQLKKEDLASRYKIAIDLDSNYRYTSNDLPDSLPILILEGEKDKIANQRVRDLLRELYPNARSHVFKGAGHSAMMTHTKEWSNVIRDFLS